MSESNGGSESDKSRRLDRAEELIQQIIIAQAGMLNIIKESRAEIQESRAEVHDLITLQREQRIDIMALFEANKELREILVHRERKEL